MGTKFWKDLTEGEARTWLMNNDPEASGYWKNCKEYLKESVAENLRDFGEKNQVENGLKVDLEPLE